MGTAGAFKYPGSELELFSRAKRWKAYLRAQIEPYLGRNVLEVGAGLGSTTAALCKGDFQRWTCLEPDASMAGLLQQAAEEGRLPTCCDVACSTIDRLGVAQRYDTVLYIDVLEHIAQDGEELRMASERMEPGGHLIVLAPAHQWLSSAFDRAIGHFRRYTRATLSVLAPPHMDLVTLRYLDAVGLAASAGNRFLMRQPMPTARQIELWDRLMVPPSRVVDRCLFYRIGKSVLAVWKRAAAPDAPLPGVEPVSPEEGLKP